MTAFERAKRAQRRNEKRVTFHVATKEKRVTFHVSGAEWSTGKSMRVELLPATAENMDRIVRLARELLWGTADPEELRVLSTSVVYPPPYEVITKVTVDTRRKGIPISHFDPDRKSFVSPSENLANTLSPPRTRTHHEVLVYQPLSSEISEHIFGLQKLVAQVEAMVRESGNLEGFDAARWLRKWLEQECPALGNRRPIDYLGNLEGTKIVSGVLARMQSGAYA